MSPGFRAVAFDSQSIAVAPATEGPLVLVGKKAAGHEAGFYERFERIGEFAIGKAIGIDSAANGQANEVGFIVGLDCTRGFGGQGQQAEHFDGDWLGASSLGSDGVEGKL